MSERMELLMMKCPAWERCARKCMKNEECVVAQRIFKKAYQVVLKCPRCGRPVSREDKLMCQPCRQVLYEEQVMADRFEKANDTIARVGGIGGHHSGKNGHQPSGKNRLGLKRDNALAAKFGAESVRRMTVDENKVYQFLKDSEADPDPWEFRWKDKGESK